MITANHHWPDKIARHGGLHATISHGDILGHENLLRVITTRKSSRSVPAQSSLLLLIFCLLGVAFAHGQVSPPAAGKSAQSTSAPVPKTPSPEASKYVGAETCKTCHEEIYNAWEKTPHWKTTLNKEPSHQGCEGCHGPGADHVAGGGDKTKIYVFEDHSRQETSARCLTCHGEGHEQSHFAESAHASSEVGCLDCHSPHHAKEKAAPAGSEAAPVMLRMPHLGQGRLCQTLSPSRQRGTGAMRRLP
jgi:hypothetical protein